MKILGLDIGTNSIGGAFITIDEFGKEGKIEWLGSRIIPLDGDSLAKFESGGQVESKAANRRKFRMSRRLKHRYKLRRTRLIKVFKILGWLSTDFPENFKKRMKEDPEFKFRISDYLSFSKSTIEEATKLLGVINKKGKLAVSEDWVVYYLRKKALHEKITLQELARIIYVMNQRRGFKSGRKDLEETKVMDYSEFKESVNKGKYTDEDGNTLETQFVEKTKIKSVEQKDDKKDKKGNYTYIVTPESEKLRKWEVTWEEKRRKKPDWEGKEFKLLITLRTTKNGKVKPLKPKTPSENDWNLIMVALDNELEYSGKHPGEFFFDELEKDKNYKIRQRVIKRERYKKELKAIWQKQLELNEEIKRINENKEILGKIASILYPTQTKIKGPKCKEITSNDLYHVIANDIIYYQRDLKSQKNLVSECRYERKKFTDKEGNEIIRGYKVAPKSSPEFQEFRIWQDIHSIRVIEKEYIKEGKTYVDVDVTKEYITSEIKESLFQLFDASAEISESAILKHIGIKSRDTHKINLFANRKKLKGNETKSLIRKVFNKHDFDGEHLLNEKEMFYRLWHILYSIKGINAEKGIKNAFDNPKNGFHLPLEVVEDFCNLSEFPAQYASYSSKAIKKLLTVIRCGGLWNKKNIPSEGRERIEKLINGEFDDKIKEKTWSSVASYFLDKAKDLNHLSIDDFQGLPTWIACYVVYGRHSERETNKKFNLHDEIDAMQLVPHNSLRNPIVEQIVRETIQVVKEVWKKYGRPDEIHIELGRELKKTADERKRLSDINAKNLAEKERVRKLLCELKEGNPDSPIDIERFRIWKEGGGKVAQEKFDELFDKKENSIIVTEAEIKKYRLWADQNHKSPYTGKSIPLAKLFTPEYQVEHIIPQSKLKYDSFANLVICETAINPAPYKGNKLARLFIREFSGRTINANGKEFQILTEDVYVQHCMDTFRGRKLKNLLREDIPKDFVSRQLNDTRFITRKLSELLYPIAKDKEGIVFTGGSITHELKRKWGLNTIWRELLKPRFERLEQITGENYIEPDEEDPNKFHFNPPDPQLDLKRVDHRHHALDALMIAATTREHIRYLNSLSAADTSAELKKIKLKLVKGKIRDFRLPWPEFTREAKEKLKEVVISHKAVNRVVSKPKNKYLKWVKDNGTWVKKYVKQQSNERWMSIKRSMFKEPQGVIYLKEVKKVKTLKAFNIQIERQKEIKKKNGQPRDYVYDKKARAQIKSFLEKYSPDIKEIKKQLKNNPLKDGNGNVIKKIRVAEFNEYAVKRVPLDKSFDKKKIEKLPYAKRIIESWTNKEKKGELPNTTKKWPLPYLLIRHLDSYNGNSNEAFTGEGLEELNKKARKPITKVKIHENKNPEDKFQGSYYETDKGGNVFFVIRENIETGVRDEMFTVPLLEAIERLANKLPVADEKPGYTTIVLSPNELVYLPTLEEIDTRQVDWSDKKKVFERVYKMVSCSGTTCEFVPHFISLPLLPYDRNEQIRGEIGWNNKSERSFDDTQIIKESCIKIKIDRLGNIGEADSKTIRA